MINDITAMVLSELSYVTFGDGYEGKTLQYIVNNQTFQNAHEGDTSFRDFLKNYELFQDLYNPILNNYKLILTEHSDSNYNGIALLNIQNNEVVIASKGTDFNSEQDKATDAQMGLEVTIPQYFLDAKEFYLSANLTN